MSLDGLESLFSVGRNLDIVSNQSLMDVTALYGLVHVYTDVTITDNVLLTNPAARLLVDEIDLIGGQVTIRRN